MCKKLQIKALAAIALELLEKYRESERKAISEYSGCIAEDEFGLETEVAAYRKRIDWLRGRKEDG